MAVSLFFVVNLVINLIQRKNRSKLFVTTEKDDGKIVKFLKKKGLYKWISPNYIMRESKDFNWNLFIFKLLIEIKSTSHRMNYLMHAIGWHFMCSHIVQPSPLFLKDCHHPQRKLHLH